MRNVCREVGIVTEDELDLALSCAVEARNRYINRSGFTAHQRVCGSSLRLPESLLSGDPIDRYAVAMDPSTEVLRSAAIRDSAVKAHLKSSDESALQRAALGRSRNPPPKSIFEGTWYTFFATMSGKHSEDG